MRSARREVPSFSLYGEHPAAFHRLDTVALEETQTRFDGPVAVIVPAGTIHSFRFRSDTRGFVLTVNLETLSSIASAAPQARIESL